MSAVWKTRDMLADDLTRALDRLQRLTEYAQHKNDCALRKMRWDFNLEERDGKVISVDDIVQGDGPGDTCTCGLTDLLKDV